MAELSSQARSKLKPSTFVFPKDRRYPINDLNHAKNALARSSGKPEESAVKKAVYSKFPTLAAHSKHDEPKDDCPHCMSDAEGQPTAEDQQNNIATALANEHDEKHGRHEDCPNCAARKDGAACDAHADDTMSLNGPSGAGSIGGEAEPQLLGGGSTDDPDEDDPDEDDDDEHMDAKSWTSILRVDRGELRKPQYLDNGYVKVDAYISRAGLLTYTTDTGKPWIEYRPPEEAFKEDSLDSFALMPLTNTHPRDGLLDSENTRLYQVGTVDKPRQDGDKVRTRLLVTDADAVKAMKRGRLELSCGYTCDVDNTPGEVNGQRYDAIQRNVRGNHVALVDAGRAGSEVRARMDGLGMVQSFLDQEINLATKIKIDGVDYDTSEAGAQAFTKAMNAAKDSLDKATARADGLEKEVGKLKADLKVAPEKVRAEIENRIAVESDARRILGEGAKFDGKSDLEVKREAAEKHRGVKLDGRSDAYIEAAFDQAVESLDGEGDAPGLLAAARNPTTGTIATNDQADANLKFLEDSMNASKAKTRTAAK